MPRKSLALSLFLAPSTMPLDDDTLEEEEEKFKRARAWMVFQKQPLENAGKQSAKNSWNDSRKPSSGPFGKLLFLFFLLFFFPLYNFAAVRTCRVVREKVELFFFPSEQRVTHTHTHTEKIATVQLVSFLEEEKKIVSSHMISTVNEPAWQQRHTHDGHRLTAHTCTKDLLFFFTLPSPTLGEMQTAQFVR